MESLIYSLWHCLLGHDRLYILRSSSVINDRITNKKALSSSFALTAEGVRAMRLAQCVCLLTGGSGHCCHWLIMMVNELTSY